MFSILWYSLFAFLSGFSATYRMLSLFRALFGIGMGGVWAAGMPLTLEHWPAQLRGIASGMLQAGYSFGFMLSIARFRVRLSAGQAPRLGWRVMMWIGVLPRFWSSGSCAASTKARSGVERHQRCATTARPARLSIARLFRRDLLLSRFKRRC